MTYCWQIYLVLPTAAGQPVDARTIDVEAPDISAALQRARLAQPGAVIWSIECITRAETA